MSKKKDARQTLIRQILLEENEIRVIELAKRLNITPETLRKDLDEMEEQQMIIREHGYARIQALRTELPIAYRSKENPEDKRKIMLRAIQEIKNGQVVFLDAGSTILQGIQALRSKKDLTLIVNSIPVALECLEMNFKVIFIGGTMMKNGLRTDGYFTQKMLDSIYIDVAILGSDGIKDSSGFTVFQLEEIGTRRHIINQSRKLVVVCDSHKFAIEPHYQFCRFDEVDILITNSLTDEQSKQVEQIKKIIQV